MARTNHTQEKNKEERECVRVRACACACECMRVCVCVRPSIALSLPHTHTDNDEANLRRAMVENGGNVGCPAMELPHPVWQRGQRRNNKVWPGDLEVKHTSER